MNSLEKLFKEVKETYKNVYIINFDGDDNIDGFIGALYDIKLDIENKDIIFTLIDQDDNSWDVSYDDIKDCSFEEYELEDMSL